MAYLPQILFTLGLGAVWSIILYFLLRNSKPFRFEGSNGCDISSSSGLRKNTVYGQNHSNSPNCLINTMNQRDKKPFGIVLIAIYSILSALMFLFTGFAFLLASTIPDVPIWAHLISFVCGIMGILLLASVYGLWSLQAWGWKLTFWLYVASIPLGILSIFPIWPGTELTAGNIIMQAVGIGLDIVVILYLLKEPTKDLYTIY